MRTISESNQRIESTIGRIFLTAIFMFGFVLASVYAYRLVAGQSSDSVIDLPLIILGTAIGGATGIRVARVSWRQTAVAALLSVIGLIIYSRFVWSFPGPWVPGGSDRVLDPTTALSYLAVGTAGVFLLPLFDPVVRRGRPTPSLAYIALFTVTLTVLIILIDYLLGGGSFFGLLTLVFGSIASAVLVGVGMILALAHLTAVGAWLGGLGLVLEVSIVIAWWLLGAPFFP